MLAKALIIKLLLLAGFTQPEADTMLCIAKWESAYNPIAININTDGSVDYGLFQINSKWWLDRGASGCSQSREELLTPDGNIACAKFIFDKMGYKAWVAYRIRSECNPALKTEEKL